MRQRAYVEIWRMREVWRARERRNSWSRREKLLQELLAHATPCRSRADDNKNNAHLIFLLSVNKFKSFL